MEEGETVTLHWDTKCASDSIGTGTVATGETSATITYTGILFSRYNRIYAKVGEVCSLSGADYTLTGGAVKITGDKFSDRTHPHPDHSTGG